MDLKKEVLEIFQNKMPSYSILKIYNIDHSDTYISLIIKNKWGIRHQFWVCANKESGCLYIMLKKGGKNIFETYKFKKSLI